jgi:GNAT superfamily N-acetyltransferase
VKLENLKCINDSINLKEYIKFRELVKENMPNPEWLGDFTKEELIEMLNNNTKIWIYYLNKEPVCSMMLIPSTEKDISKFELNISHTLAVDYGPIFVNPKYQGNGLQYQMLQILDKYVKEHNYKYIITTIHPDNIYCIRNFLKDDFKLINQKVFKRGPRNIYLKEI